jgi:hypothetical protein
MGEAGKRRGQRSLKVEEGGGEGNKPKPWGRREGGTRMHAYVRDSRKASSERISE